ncbi:VTT domain-containing protein [Streptomyces sp. 549]|uniref:DedA family protein n=1 Tax=Streptomyces sp. 549 TaxID=3049076 RepID=UPI0024C37FF5|nr:VTT domain-containing protein [Streptomyces sp. 549]MDK1473990.1 VTT domain-containing protein [Streptomyces sp. 549]
MLETLGTLVYAPWIYVLIALSVLLDVFLPLLPSGVLVIAAATAAAGTAADLAGVAAPPTTGAHLPEMFLLVLCAATASVLGDLAAFHLARYGGPRLNRLLSRSRRIAGAQDRLETVLLRGGGSLMVLARFAPAGRSVMSLTAGAARRHPADFATWSAVAGLAWALYSVSLGYFGGQLFGVSWGTTALSVLALFTAGTLAGYLLHRRPTAATA